MRVAVRFGLIIFVCLASTACITALTTIKVGRDGSGTIEQTMSMKAAVAEQLAGMMKGLQDETGGADAAAGGELDLFSEKEMMEAASKMGEGVTFVSSQPIRTNERVGRVATYRFSDITGLRINQKPASPGPAGEVPGGDEAEDVLFRFARQPAGSSTVTVIFPEAELEKALDEADDADEQESDAPETPDPAQLEMMKQIFDGLRIAINLDVDGTIVKTNSPHVQGSRVTLLEMDFSELLTNEAMLGKVATPKSIEEAKVLLQGLKGFKVNLDREVTVEFR